MTLLSTTGVALIIIALVERSHLERSLESIYKQMGKKLEEQFKDTFQIIENSEYWIKRHSSPENG